MIFRGTSRPHAWNTTSCRVEPNASGKPRTAENAMKSTAAMIAGRLFKTDLEKQFGQAVHRALSPEPLRRSGRCSVRENDSGQVAMRQPDHAMAIAGPTAGMLRCRVALE